MQESQDASVVPAAHLFHVLGREMEEMAASAERLQTILVSACAFASDGNRRFLRDAQACDLLTQRLADLMEFLDRVAREAPSNWVIDVREACRTIRLSDLSGRLCLEPTTRSEHAGDVELFE